MFNRISNFVNSLSSAFAKPTKDKNSLNILLIAYYDPNGINTIIEHVEKIKAYSDNKVEIYNMFGKRYPRGFELPKAIKFNEYNAVIIHNTVSYNPDNLFRLDRSLKTKFAEYQGIKVLLKQDEHFRTNHVIEFFNQSRFNILVSVLPESKIHQLYPENKIKAHFIQAHTGYISDELKSIRNTVPLAERQVDIGYRGSIQPFNFGWLSYEKKMIGDKFIDLCSERGLSFDISSQWEDRFQGGAWIEFLSKCKGILGVESGSSIIDYDGKIELETAHFLKVNPGADFLQTYEKILKKYENNGYYKAISPRHLEAAACGAVQILFEGDYSEIFKPDVHFIPLAHDFSNVDEVFKKFENFEYCNSLVSNSYNDIINNPDLNYRAFVKSLDSMLEKLSCNSHA